MEDLTSILTGSAKKFIDAYYVAGDAAAAAACLDLDRVSWFGSSSGVWASGREDIERLLMARCARMRAIHAHVVEHECRVALRAEGCAVVLSRILMQSERPDIDSFGRRISFVLAPSSSGVWRIVHVHASVAASNNDHIVPFEAGSTPAVGTRTDLVGLSDGLRREHARYKIVAQLSDDLIYDYDIKRDTLQLFSLGASHAGEKDTLTLEHCWRDFNVDHIVHHDDAQRFRDDCAVMLRGTLTDGGDSYVREYRMLPLSGFENNETPGDYRYWRVIGRIVRDSDGQMIKTVGKVVDVSSEHELMQLSQTDELTGAFNRSYLLNCLKGYAHSKQRDAQYACLLIDVDFFKLINDSRGHLTGDDVLVELVRVARPLFRVSDVVARLGGDEFMVFMADVHDAETVVKKAQTLITRFAEAIASWALPDGVGLSIGVVVERDILSSSELYRRADVALYQAKAAGKNQVVLFEANMTYPKVSPE